MKAKKLTRKPAIVKLSTMAESRTGASRVRQHVRDLLTSSSSYRALSADRRREIAKGCILLDRHPRATLAVARTGRVTEPLKGCCRYRAARACDRAASPERTEARCCGSS